MLYRISVTERGLTGIANIFRSRLSRLDDLLGAGTVPLRCNCFRKRTPSTFLLLLSQSAVPYIVFSEFLDIWVWYRSRYVHKHGLPSAVARRF